MAIIIEKQTFNCENGKNNSKLEKEYIYWQAHQSTSTILPENTMAAFLYAWNLGGIPEADIRTAGDGVIICMHDSTPARTIDIPDSQKNLIVSSFTLEQIKKWDAGIKTGEAYKNERVPTLEKVFENMRNQKDRLLYLDLKDVDLDSLANLIEEYSIADQIIFTHNNEENCRKMHEMVKGLRTMLWIGGSPDRIKDKFNKVLSEKFYGLNQVQIHLYNKENPYTSGGLVTKEYPTTNESPESLDWPYQIDKAFLEDAYDKAVLADIDLEVLPYEFDDRTLHSLLDIGIRWFAVDYPEKFVQTVKRY